MGQIFNMLYIEDYAINEIETMHVYEDIEVKIKKLTFECSLTVIDR